MIGPQKFKYLELVIQLLPQVKKTTGIKSSFQLKYPKSYKSLDLILNNGQILNWNGEWMRKRNKTFDAQLNPFLPDGGSLAKTTRDYQGQMHVNSGQIATWQHSGSALPICKYQGNLS